VRLGRQWRKRDLVFNRFLCRLGSCRRFVRLSPKLYRDNREATQSQQARCGPPKGKLETRKTHSTKIHGFRSLLAERVSHGLPSNTA